MLKFFGMGNRQTSHSGFTLLETVLAAVLFAVATIFLSTLFTNAQRGSARSNQRFVANALASRYVETAVSEGKVGMVPAAATGQVTVNATRRGHQMSVVYDWQVNVNSVADELHSVTVSVSWIYQGEKQTVLREVLVHPT